MLVFVKCAQVNNKNEEIMPLCFLFKFGKNTSMTTKQKNGKLI